MRLFHLAVCLGIGFAWAFPQMSHAQVIWGGAAERGLRPGVNIPHDGAPYSHRYNYSTDMSYFMFGGNAQQLHMLDYLDRLDRAEKFGYRIPAPPPALSHPSGEYPRRTFFRFGIGSGLYRWR